LLLALDRPRTLRPLPLGTPEADYLLHELTPEERRAHGVDLVLVKPLQIQEILDAVAEVARTRRPAS
jgi:hypothetical protein